MSPQVSSWHHPRGPKAWRWASDEKRVGIVEIVETRFIVFL